MWRRQFLTLAGSLAGSAAVGRASSLAAPAGTHGATPHLLDGFPALKETVSEIMRRVHKRLLEAKA